jgi:hypothetical protein
MDYMRRFLDSLDYMRLPEDPILTYDYHLEECVNREYIYLLIDKETYRAHKCDANQLDVYQQEISLRTHMLRLVRYRKQNDPGNCLYDWQIQILEKDMSRYCYLLEELREKVRCRP